VVGSTDIYDVLVAIVAAVPATIGALTAFYVARQLRTPSKRSVGKQIEDVNHTSRSNWHMLNATRRDVGIPMPTEAVLEVESVEGIDADQDE
jgi:hypothetical protein